GAAPGSRSRQNAAQAWRSASPARSARRRAQRPNGAVRGGSVTSPPRESCRQNGPGGQVQARLEARRDSLQGCGPPFSRQSRKIDPGAAGGLPRRDHQGPPAVRAAPRGLETQAERRVALHQDMESPRQQTAVEELLHLQQESLIEVVGVLRRSVEKPALDRGERDRTGVILL